MLRARFDWGFFDNGELADEQGGRISLDDEERGGEDEVGGGGSGVCEMTTATWGFGFELFWFWHLNNNI